MALYIALVITLACSNRQAQSQQPTERRMVYVQPEALPPDYDWQFRSVTFTDIVWVGYRFNERGELQYANAKQLPRLMKNKPQKQYLLLSLKNIPSGTILLTDPTAGEHSRKSAAAVLSQYPEISGVQFDFEHLPPRLSSNYTAYIQRMRNFIHRSIELQVAVFPPVDFPEHLKDFHDLPALLQASDGLVVMLYDRHRPGSKPGCVTPLGWLQQNLAELQKLPRGKLWLGVPLYGYKFSTPKTTAISRSAFYRNYTSYRWPAASGKNTSPRYTPYKYEDGCLVQELSDGSKLYYPAEELYETYATAYKKYGFAGLAFWRAGWER